MDTNGPIAPDLRYNGTMSMSNNFYVKCTKCLKFRMVKQAEDIVCTHCLVVEKKKKEKIRTRTQSEKRVLRAKNYNVSVEYLDKLFKEQENKCAICRVEVKSWLDLQIDHDHQCCDRGSCGNCIRGLICLHCNSGLGMFKENVATLNSAINYIQSYKNLYNVNN